MTCDVCGFSHSRFEMDLIVGGMLFESNLRALMAGRPAFERRVIAAHGRRALQFIGPFVRAVEREAGAKAFRAVFS